MCRKNLAKSIGCDEVSGPVNRVFVAPEPGTISRNREFTGNRRARYCVLLLAGGRQPDVDKIVELCGIIQGLISQPRTDRVSRPSGPRPPILVSRQGQRTAGRA